MLWLQPVLIAHGIAALVADHEPRPLPGIPSLASLPTVTDASTEIPSRSSTVAPASPVPLNVGVSSFVTLSAFELPLSLAAARSGVEGGVI
jgi:hypothetical protein